MPECRHILTTGRRCKANAMLDKAFCYFHYNINEHHRALNPPVTSQYLAERGITREELSHPAIARSEGFLLNRPTMFNFPPLEDADAIQLAISMVVTALGEYRLEPKRGATILFGLQVANSNNQIKRPNPDSDPVHETTTDAEGREVALDERITEVARDERVTEVARDERVTEVARDERDTEVARDERGTEVARDERITEVARDERVTEVARDERDTEVSASTARF